MSTSSVVTHRRTVPATRIVLSTMLVAAALTGAAFVGGSSAYASSSSGKSSPPRGGSGPTHALGRLVATPAEVRAATPRVEPGDRLSEFEASMARDFPSTFGGIYVTSDGTLVVPTVGRAPALRSWASGHFAPVAREVAASHPFARGSRADENASPGPTLSFTDDDSTSFEDLVELKAAILADPDLTSDGVIGAGLDIENDAVIVTSTGGPVDAELEATYGDEVEIEDVSTPTLVASRTNDNPPWNGGDMIVTSGGTLCTLGYGVHDTTTGANYSVTAGHCGSAKWYNLPRNGTAFTAANLVGSTVGGTMLTSNVDAQLVGSSSSCIVWGSGTSRYFMTGYADAPQGAAVLTEGSVSGNQSASVQTYDWSGTFAGESIDNGDLLSTSVLPGDSGGPVVYPTGFGPLVAGTIVGNWINNQTGSTQILVQNVDAELYDLSAALGDPVTPNTSSTGVSC